VDTSIRCQARLMEGRSWQRARDRQKAAEILEGVLEDCEDSNVRMWAHYKAGRSLQAIGEYNAALAHFLALPDEDPTHRLADDGLILAGRLYAREGDIE